MHRIDTSTAQKDKFGAGKNGFTTGDPQSGTPATEVSAEILDALQEEIAAVIEDPASGLTLSKSNNGQLIAAIKKIIAANAVPNASDTVSGISRFSTSAELISGLLPGVGVSPKTLKAGLSEQLTATGYRVPPPWLSGLIEQWGVTGVIGDGDTATVTLPIPFPTMGLNGVATVVTVAGSTASTEVSVIDFPTPSTMRIAFNSSSGATSTVRYRAWGK